MTPLLKAFADYEAATARHADAQLDLKIAERGGDPAAIEAAKMALTESTNLVWYPAYTARRAAAENACAELGVTPAQMRAALP